MDAGSAYETLGGDGFAWLAIPARALSVHAIVTDPPVALRRGFHPGRGLRGRPCRHRGRAASGRYATAQPAIPDLAVLDVPGRGFEVEA